jgi:hypothetical protein
MALIPGVTIQFAVFRQAGAVLVADLFIVLFAFVGVTQVFDLTIL